MGFRSLPRNKKGGYIGGIQEEYTQLVGVEACQRWFSQDPRRKRCFDLTFRGYKVTEVCKMIGLSRDTYYRWRNTPEWNSTLRRTVQEVLASNELRRLHEAIAHTDYLIMKANKYIQEDLESEKAVQEGRRETSIDNSTKVTNILAAVRAQRAEERLNAGKPNSHVQVQGDGPTSTHQLNIGLGPDVKGFIQEIFQDKLSKQTELNSILEQNIIDAEYEENPKVDTGNALLQLVESVITDEEDIIETFHERQEEKWNEKQNQKKGKKA